LRLAVPVPDTCRDPSSADQRELVRQAVLEALDALLAEGIEWELTP
jgi:hypothetical protein